MNAERATTLASGDIVVEEIVHIVRETMGDQVSRVLLYGSRAEGRARPDSDFDVLVITRETAHRDEARKRLSQSFAHLPVVVDVRVMGEREFEETKDVVGGLAYPAQKHGRDLL